MWPSYHFNKIFILKLNYLYIDKTIVTTTSAYYTELKINNNTVFQFIASGNMNIQLKEERFILRFAD